MATLWEWVQNLKACTQEQGGTTWRESSQADLIGKKLSKCVWWVVLNRIDVGSIYRSGASLFTCTHLCTNMKWGTWEIQFSQFLRQREGEIQMLVSDAKEIWFHFQTNPCKSFPEFEAISMRGPDASFKGKEIWFHFETNPYDWFPKFEAVGESPFNFEGVFRHFVMNFSDSFWLQTSFKAYGRANPSKKVSCNQFSLSWGPSKIPQPLSEGRHSRLSIWQPK